MTMLHIGSKQRLRLTIGIGRHRLKLINGYDARLICLVDVSKDFLHCYLRLSHLTDT